MFDALEHTCTPSINLRMLVSGGAPLPPPLLDQADRLRVPLVHSYGMTEASPLVLVGRLTSKFRETSPEGTRERRLRQGMLVPGLEMAVMKDGRPVPWDGRTPGELWLRGPWIAERYRNAPELASAFDGGWYHSGDVVDVDPDGYVRVVDRISDLIKSGGEWISSIELENALVECPGITAAAVISVPDPKWSERPAAYVVADARVTDDDIRQHLLRRFPAGGCPMTSCESNLSRSLPSASSTSGLSAPPGRKSLTRATSRVRGPCSRDGREASTRSRKSRYPGGPHRHADWCLRNWY